MTSANADKKRIFVVGKTGVGKSSIIRHFNATNKQSQIPSVSNSSRGETFTCELYENENYIFADTIGFGETASGTNPTSEMLYQFISFLLDNVEGFNLVLFVHDNDRIDESVVKAYQAINALIKVEVPKILVRTKDAVKYGQYIDSTTLDEWKKDQCNFHAGCRVHYPNLDELKASDADDDEIRVTQKQIDKSRDKISILIRHLSLEKSIQLFSPDGFFGFLRHMWNYFAVLFSWSSQFAVVAENFIAYFMALGDSELVATDKAAKIERRIFIVYCLETFTEFTSHYKQRVRVWLGTKDEKKDE